MLTLPFSRMPVEWTLAVSSRYFVLKFGRYEATWNFVFSNNITSTIGNQSRMLYVLRRINRNAAQVSIFEWTHIVYLTRQTRHVRGYDWVSVIISIFNILWIQPPFAPLTPIPISVPPTGCSNVSVIAPVSRTWQVKTRYYVKYGWSFTRKPCRFFR